MKQHPEDNGLCSYKVLARFQGSCSKDTAEKASQEVGIKPPVVESTACSSRLVPATSAGKPAAHLQGRMQLNAVTFLEETPSLEDGTLPQGSVDSSSGATPYIVFGDATDEYPGVERSTSAGVAPDAPHQKAASTRFNSCIEEPFDSTHAKRTLGVTCHCVDFAYIDRDSFRALEAENWVIKIQDKIPRCHPPLGAISPGIIGASSVA